MVDVVRGGQYTFGPYAEMDTGQVLALMEAALGAGPAGRRDRAGWDWKHLRSPFGGSYVRLARAQENDAVVGLRAFMRWQFKLDGRAVNAVRAVDTATHPQHRRRGLFEQLTKQMLEEMRADGVDLVFNTPNRFSMPGYLKMGWRHVGVIRPLVKVINYPRFIAGLIRYKLGRQAAHQTARGSQWDAIEPASESRLDVLETLLDQDKAWQEAHRLTTNRSPAYLRWRYAQHPAATYGVITHQTGGRVEAAAIVRANSRFGLNEVMIEELLLSAPRADLVKRVIAQMVTHTNADYLIAVAPEGSVKRRLIAGSGFRSVPRYGMDFTALRLNQALAVDPYQLGGWALTLGDLEYF